MDQHLYSDRPSKPPVVSYDDDDDDDDMEEDDTDGTGEDTDTANIIICPSCGEDLDVVDKDELFEGAELTCDACGAQLEVTGLYKNMPTLKQIEDQK